MSYEVRIHAPSDLSEKWYVYIYSGGKIIKKFYKGLAKESTYTDRMLKAEILKSIIEKEIKTGWKPDAPELPTPENNNYSIERSLFNRLQTSLFYGKRKNNIKSI